jgi:16S rRNA (guanine527-N7)-methyltransferase
LDIGTGGGFPGIPLAIMYPEVTFTLVDSIGKKIRAVEEVVEILELKNVTALNSRAENLRGNVDIAVARAVAPTSELWHLMENKWSSKPCFYLLKGGDLTEELNELLHIFPGTKIAQHQISKAFSEEYFETKKVLELHGR